MDPALRKERAYKVAQDIQNHPEHFNMTYYLGFPVENYRRDRTYALKDYTLDKFVSECGTLACIAGFAALRARQEHVGFEGLVLTSRAACYLGLDDDQADSLFRGAMYNANGELTSPEQAVQLLQHYGDTGEVDLSITEHKDFTQKDS